MCFPVIPFSNLYNLLWKLSSRAFIDQDGKIGYIFVVGLNLIPATLDFDGALNLF
jgi:hypothetical protein